MRDSGWYTSLGQGMEGIVSSYGRGKKLNLSRTIQALREKSGLTGAELCRRSGKLDPRTLNAIEKGRIQNPSLVSLQALAGGLGVLVRDIFTTAEMELGRNFYQGSSKGAFQTEFPRLGLRVVSLTPPNPHFFFGKLFLAPKRKVDDTLLKQSALLFFEVIIGRVEFAIEDKLVPMEAGENLFFDGQLKHSLRNLLNREAVLWFVFFPADK